MGEWGGGQKRPTDRSKTSQYNTNVLEYWNNANSIYS